MAFPVDMPSPAHIRTFVEPGYLQQRLDEIPQGEAPRHIEVGVTHSGESSVARVADDANGEPEPFRTGCITKLFTGALLRQLVCQDRVGIDFPVAEYLGDATAHAAGVYSRITLKHLLDHTHGLDDSALSGAPQLANGHVDAERLTRQLVAAERLFSPGTLYSYSNAGAWLIAAVLEKLTGTTWRALLRERLFRPLRLGAGQGSAPAGEAAAARICPSVGEDLAVSVIDLLRFLRYAMSYDPLSWPTAIFRLPGFSPFERGICNGWKSYGRNWFGHHSTWPGASVLVRIRPAHGTALVVASRQQPALLVAARLFGEILPEFSGLIMPRRLTSDEIEAMDSHRYAGIYRSASESVSISCCADGGLQMEVDSTRRKRPSSFGKRFSTGLRPAADDIFLPEPGAAGRFPFVQFIAHDRGSRRYLWNGRCIWPKRPGSSPVRQAHQ